MSQKKRFLFAIIIAAVIVAAVFSSFALSFLFRSSHTITLPDISSTASPAPTQSRPGEEDGFLPVSVTPDTVQSVIRTLSRPESYQRSFTVSLFWSDGESAETSVQVWQENGLTRVELTPPTGLVQYNLLDAEHLYRWYSGSSSYAVLPCMSDSDLAQRIPTYEDVLALPTRSIQDAGYITKEGVPCIYVAVADGGQTADYWISISSGLLAGAEIRTDGALTYSLSAYGQVTTPCPSGVSFALPDGTALS